MTQPTYSSWGNADYYNLDELERSEPRQARSYQALEPSNPNASSIKLTSSTNLVNEMDVQDYAKRYEELRNVEGQKNKLIEDLIQQYSAVNSSLRILTEDLEREQDFNRQSQREKKHLNQKIQNLQSTRDSNPFVLLLVDADGMIFQEELLKRGEMGGREAAHFLNEAVLNHLRTRTDSINLPPDTRVVARLYANMRGLGEVLYRAGIVDSPYQLEEFMKGFTRSKSLYDFVDVGAGKDRADDKLTEIFKLHLRDYHCRQIVFGCSHDNGYARLLEEFSADLHLKQRITLLEGAPLERELRNLGFTTTKFEHIFRSSKINLHPYQPNQMPRPPQPSFDGASSLSDVNMKMPVEEVRTLLPPARAASVATSPGSDSSITYSPPTSWANLANRVGKPSDNPKPLMSPPPPPVGPPEIPRNRKGQRVDPLIPHDKATVDRVKSMKLCNVHYLRQECPYGDNCTHRHDEKLDKSQLNTLRLVARMAPCTYGSDCDDPKCTYGHICPAPEGKNGQLCIFGEKCRFTRDVHNIDRTVVKTVKV